MPSDKKDKILKQALEIILAFVAVILFVPSISHPKEPRSIDLDDICKNIHNSYECAQAIEHYQKKYWGKYFVRKKGQLEFALTNGKIVILKDIEDSPKTNPDEVKLYSFRDYIQSIGYFLIHLQYYEGDEYLMINAKTGKQYLIPAPPYLSPNKKRFVSVSASEAYNFNGIKIWEIAADGLRLEWTYEPGEYALYNFIEWVDNKTIKVNKFTIKNNKEVNIHQLLRKDEDSNWKLVND